MLKLLSNSIGSSILAVMVIGSVITASGVYFIKRHENSTKKVVSNKTILETNIFINRIHNQFVTPALCKNTLGNDDLRTAILSEIKNKANIVIFDTIHKFGSNTLSINQIEIKGGFDPDLQAYSSIEEAFGPAPISSGSTRSGEINIIFTLQKENPSSLGASTIKKSFPLMVKVNPKYEVIECFSTFADLTENVRNESCRNLGGNYSPKTGCSLIGGPGMGVKIKEATCEMLNAKYDPVDGICDGFDLSMNCPGGYYLQGFDLISRLKICSPIVH